MKIIRGDFKLCNLYVFKDLRHSLLNEILIQTLNIEVTMEKEKTLQSPFKSPYRFQRKVSVIV